MSVVSDIRYSLRMLAKSPGFTAIAILSLALGVGANTAIFTLINELMLQQLPVRQPDQLVSFGEASGGGVAGTVRWEQEGCFLTTSIARSRSSTSFSRTSVPLPVSPSPPACGSGEFSGAGRRRFLPDGVGELLRCPRRSTCYR